MNTTIYSALDDDIFLNKAVEILHNHPVWKFVMDVFDWENVIKPSAKNAKFLQTVSFCL